MTEELIYRDEHPEKKSSRAKKIAGRILFVLFLLAIIAGVGAAGAWTYYDHSLKTSLDPAAGEQTFIIYPGQTVKGIANKLREEGLIANPLLFRLALKIQGKDTSIEAGEYQLSKAQTMQQIIDSLKGAVKKDDQIRILEGWRINDIVDYLQKYGYPASDFASLTLGSEPYDYAFLADDATYGKPEGSNLEGYLFPDTYRVEDDITAEELVVKLLNNFQQKYEDFIEPKMSETDLSLYEVLSLASIVEREGRDAEEKKMIAAIYLNRLDLGMSLGACPTVLYALGDWKAELTQDNLQVDSPYNTRIHTGLPPGPISNPGLDSILAVLEPADTDYLYFLTDKNGIMRYAYTNAEHEANKAKYGLSGQ